MKNKIHGVSIKERRLVGSRSIKLQHVHQTLEVVHFFILLEGKPSLLLTRLWSVQYTCWWTAVAILSR